MPKLTIDGQEIEVEAGLTVLQACEQAGAEVPRFCFHERLSIAGNCRMCLVEMERAPKPVASCAMPVGEGMVITTNSPAVQKMRKGVMEFLLINHPLDCPICDQGGECDLQDQAVAFGADRSRYEENKRAVKDKYMGPLISTIMTRCIHCTRCVRFAQEIAGVPELGATGRGEHTEVGTYVEKALTSELSGNLIDLCPVGALTSAPYAYHARSWELKKTESIDVMDALGAAIRVDSRGPEVMRIMPRLNEDVNEEWISDKSRFACDGLMKRRLDRPYVRLDGKLQEASWQDAFNAIAAQVSGKAGSKIAAIAGDQVDVETMAAMKDLMAAFGSTNMDCRQDGAALDASNRASYLFNTTVAGIEQADACLIIGSNPRIESPVLNARIRKRYVAGSFPIGVIGEQADLTYAHTNLGAGAETLSDLADGKGAFAEVLNNAERPMLILGAGALARSDSAAILALAHAVADKYGMVTGDWNGFNVLHTAASRVGGMDIGFVAGEGGLNTAGILAGAASGAIETLFLLGADEVDVSKAGKTFVIYQGHHGDRGAHNADVILPGAAYTEKSATYVNLEGRVQQTTQAIFPPGDAREDWTIIRALSDVVGKTLPYNNIEDLRARMIAGNAVFGDLNTVSAASWGAFGTSGATDAAPFTSGVDNFFMTDPISRASETMAKCTETLSNGAEGKTGTDG
ncbi:MAG: NADH-quinone oxidoreductase subunit G [Rhodospirillales bacterium]|jgi:NADH-quinone oxidoreductase subunit G|nr:NADH-quinone oxidoreductase subunit G [Rhodospirillales bacterium]MBT4627747.1 NADH-quinone oxidoreductase subunit G [Rhodospirillales bacterium]MBT5352991.1 NADH-quinone oxidoreductase subunit G [Rhodospirillales bacterium]MBT6110678.1 NADH-quinone oxidoreductase subunit G [Rhodospirillales bacterium]MBT7147153.1 NADH-quinone oxidoreductase subunit G [Rhodospirillales bacterium]